MHARYFFLVFLLYCLTTFFLPYDLLANTGHNVVNAADSIEHKQLQRYHQLLKVLRCPRCEGQNIAESNAAVAVSIKNQVYELIIPINKNHGIEYNSEREKLGIPKIGENWENRKYQSDQFTTYWWKNEQTDGHFKKIVEYGILNAESETDYYRKENKKGTFAWSKYNYGNNTSEYFIEKPNDNNDSISYKGKFKMERPTILKKINKIEFEKFITE